MRSLRPSRWPPALRVVLSALLPPAVVTAAAGLGFVLAVTAAALIGGSVSGLSASLLSFLALNFFFTPPVGTFSVDKTDDLVALVVFLLVSAVVGALVSRASAQRLRAERREREARLLQHLGARLLSGASPDRVFERFGRALVELTGLPRYEVAMAPHGRVVAEVGAPPGPAMHREEFPLEVGGESVAAIRTYAKPEGPS